MKVVYIAGKCHGPNHWEVARNVRRAETVGMAVALAGAMPLVPHMLTSTFHGTVSEDFWYDGTLELLNRCDAMVLVAGWEDSKGVKSEIEYAKKNHIPFFSRVEDLKVWLANQPV